MTSLSRHRSDWKSLRAVAWVRVGAIGDLLVGLCGLAEMHELFPAARITVVGPALWTQILSPHQFPFIARIAAIERKGTTATVYEPQDGHWVKRGLTQPLHQVLRSCDGLVNTNIDSTRYGFTALRAGIPVRIGAAPPLWAWLYTHAAPHFGKDPLIHEKNAPLMLLEHARTGPRRLAQSVAKNRAHLAQWLTESELVGKWKSLGLPAAKPLSALRAAELSGARPGQYLLINPTASRREKTWPTERMRELLDDSSAQLACLGLEPLIIGAPNETDWLREVAGDRWRIVQPRDLRDLQDVVYGAKMLLTNGSSMQFIAGTTQTPTLTIFGRGQPLIWGPVGAHDAIVRAEFAGADAGSTFAGFEEETRIYQTIPVARVKIAFLEMAARPNEKRLDLGPTKV